MWNGLLKMPRHTNFTSQSLPTRYTHSKQDIDKGSDLSHIGICGSSKVHTYKVTCKWDWGNTKGSNQIGPNPDRLNIAGKIRRVGGCHPLKREVTWMQCSRWWRKWTSLKENLFAMDGGEIKRHEKKFKGKNIQKITWNIAYTIDELITETT